MGINTSATIILNPASKHNPKNGLEDTQLETSKSHSMTAFIKTARNFLIKPLNKRRIASNPSFF